MSKRQKILLSLLSLVVIGGIAWFVFSRFGSEEINYSIESLSGSTGSTMANTGTTVTDSGTISLGKKNIQIVAYASDIQ